MFWALRKGEKRLRTGSFALYRRRLHSPTNISRAHQFREWHVAAYIPRLHLSRRRHIALRQKPPVSVVGVKAGGAFSHDHRVATAGNDVARSTLICSLAVYVRHLRAVNGALRGSNRLDANTESGTGRKSYQSFPVPLKAPCSGAWRQPSRYLRQVARSKPLRLMTRLGLGDIARVGLGPGRSPLRLLAQHLEVA